MNAKELHDIYSPLWALVPETRFTNEDGERLCCRRDKEYWTWANESGTYQRLSGLMDSIAAALCRVAVEDWLTTVRHKEVELLPPDGSDAPFGVAVYPQVSTRDRQIRCVFPNGDEAVDYMADTIEHGPTIHHAIVAAALAVAGAAP